jgi:hypothetical protein
VRGNRSESLRSGFGLKSSYTIHVRGFYQTSIFDNIKTSGRISHRQLTCLKIPRIGGEFLVNQN